MTVGEAPPILLYTRFKVILPDSVSVSTACFSKEYPGSPNRCCPMMSVYFSKSMTGRTTEGGLELFRAVDQETFRFTEIDFGEVKFYFGAVVGTLRQMRREKSRYLLGGGDGRRADDFGFFRVIARNEVSAQQEQDCFQNQNVGFHVVMVLGLK